MPQCASVSDAPCLRVVLCAAQGTLSIARSTFGSGALFLLFISFAAVFHNRPVPDGYQAPAWNLRINWTLPEFPSMGQQNWTQAGEALQDLKQQGDEALQDLKQQGGEAVQGLKQQGMTVLHGALRKSNAVLQRLEREAGAELQRLEEQVGFRFPAAPPRAVHLVCGGQRTTPYC